MNTTRRGLLISGALGVLLTGSGRAQTRPLEFGLDGAISVSRVDGVGGSKPSTVQSWAFPVQRLRAGFFPADGVQLQLTMAFSVADWGEVSTVRFNVGIGAAYRLTGQGARSGLFASGGLAVDLLSHNGSDAQWTFGGGIGYKVPLGDRLAFRPALEIGRSVASTLRPGNTTVSALVGLSYFTN